MKRQHLTRRGVLGGLSAATALALVGCGGRETAQTDDAQTSGAPSPTPQLASLIVYRDPSCGCCEAWAGIARNAGYQVQLVDHQDMPAIKREHCVPDQLLSCHTTIAGDYAIEGHVPLDDVRRLLAERPRLKGIGVAGMPLGSPGMEVPDGTREPFQVMAFDAAGRISPFRSAS